MASKVAFIDTQLAYKINRHANRLLADESFTFYGLELDPSNLVVCAGLFRDESIDMPLGGQVKNIGDLANRNSPTSSMIILTENHDGNLMLSFTGFTSKVVDTRFMLHRHFVTFVGVPLLEQTHLRIRRLDGEYVSETCQIQDADSASIEQQFGSRDRILFIDSYIDTCKLDTKSDSIRCCDTDDESLVCALLPRTTSIKTIVDVFRQPGAPSRVLTSSRFPFPVMHSSHGTGLWLGDEGSVIRDIHYRVEQIFPDDAVIVRDGYDFYHYEIDGYLDAGWGCAYRGIQMMASWFSNLYNLFPKVPSIEDIQGILKRADYAHVDMRIGSRTWIGCIEANTVLSELSDGRIDCRVLHADSVRRLSEILFNEVRDHILEFGSPVMLGAGEYAYVVGGVSRSTSQVLILDPHYTGRSNVEPCAWKPVAEFLDFKKIRGAFVNICLPRLQDQIG